MPKRLLRSQLLAERRALRHDLWSASSHAAQLNLLALDEYDRAECVALYAPIHNEVDTALIMAAVLRAGKRLLYPAVCGHHLVFRPVERIEDLQAGAFGILEPCPIGGEHSAGEADLIVVPGVAFDRSGHRLGYGKGFYDRFFHLSGVKAHLVGLCHDFQLTDGVIPADPHDIPMGIVVTDARVIRVRRLGAGK